MKKIYTISAALVLAFAANAQRAVGTATPMQPIPHSSVSVQSMPVTDTLAPDADWTQQPTLYSSSGGGFVVGNNSYGDLQKTQIYRPGVPVTVIGAIYWFGAKQVGGNGNVAMRIYHLDGNNGTSTAGTGQVCPNTTYVSDNVAIGNVDTSLSLASAYVHTYSAPQFCAGDFAVGFFLGGLTAGDTIGLVSTADPNANTEDSWEEWSDNSWHTMLEPNNWGLNIALAIFPMVDASSGIDQAGFINDIKVGLAGPNPTMDNTAIAYELRNNVSNVTITVLDAQGRVVSTESNDNVAAGRHTFDFNGSSLAAGTYYVQFNAGAANHVAIPVVKK
jgi:hypothetical protein